MNVRTGTRAALTLGLVVSLGANVAQAQPTALGRIVASWSPAALLVAVELITRIPVTSGPLGRLRLGCAGGIAAVAAWVSYWHIEGLAARAGEGAVAAHFLPLTVDGLIAVASVCLVELSATRPAARPTPVARPQVVAQVTADLAPPRADDTPEPAKTASRVEPQRAQALALEHPEWTQAELGAELGCSERTVRRHLAAASEIDKLIADLTREEVTA